MCTPARCSQLSCTFFVYSAPCFRSVFSLANVPQVPAHLQGTLNLAHLCTNSHSSLLSKNCVFHTSRFAYSWFTRNVCKARLAPHTRNLITVHPTCCLSVTVISTFRFVCPPRCRPHELRFARAHLRR